jgi:hypothetical protein
VILGNLQDAHFAPLVTSLSDTSIDTKVMRKFHDYLNFFRAYLEGEREEKDEVRAGEEERESGRAGEFYLLFQMLKSISKLKQLKILNYFRDRNGVNNAFSRSPAPPLSFIPLRSDSRLHQ